MKRHRITTLVILIVLAALFIPLGGVAGQDYQGDGSTALFSSFVELEQEEHLESIGALAASTAETASYALRVAKVELSAKALDAIKFTPGEMISVALFDNQSLDVRLRKVEMIGEAAAARGQVEGSDFGFMIATSFEDLALIIVELPDQNKQFKVVYDHALGEHILYEFNLDELDKLPESAPLIPLSEQALAEVAAEALQSSAYPATIDVMIVYTPAASTWATANATSILNVIALAMAKADEVMENSSIEYGYQLIEFRMVVSSQIAYIESGNSITDLERMTYGTHGFDVVHGLRNTYGADLVALFAHVSDTGGLGWLLDKTGGDPYFGYSLTRVQQAHNTFTHVHEMGHNMGAHHHKYQNVQPGPGLYKYSAGWRWSFPSNTYYCSVMTYEGGQYFADGNPATRVAVFSNPRLQHNAEGTHRLVGHALDGDNARGLNNVRRVVSNYRAPYDASLILGIPSGTWWFTEGGGGKWDFVSPSPASTITYSDQGGDGILNLFASFGSGTWYVDSHGYWQQLTTSTASALAGRSFGWLALAIPSGTWLYDAWNGTWSQLSSVPAHALTWADTTGDNSPDTLFASYSSGLWAVKNWSPDPLSDAPRGSEANAFELNATWHRVTTSTVRAMSGCSGGWIVASMPSGLWLYDAIHDSWVKHYTTSTARDITFTDMTGNGFTDMVVGLHSGTWYITYYDIWPDDPINSERGQVGEVGTESITWYQLTRSTAGALQRSHGLPY